MKLRVRRRETVLAERRLQREQDIWHMETTMIRASVSRHRGALAAGAGCVAGLLCGLMPLRSTARLGRFLANVIGFALRTPIVAMLVDGAKHRARSQAGSPQDIA